MKKLILFLLFPVLSFGQTPKVAPSRDWRGPLPVLKPSNFNVNQDLFLDTKTLKGYFHSGTSWYADTITPKFYQGVPGPVGPQGPQGVAGQQGVKGDQGIQGQTGAQGLQGIQGQQGPIGATGPMGPQGPPGSGGGSTPGRTFITPYLLNDFGEIVIGGHNSTQTVAQAGVNPSVYVGMIILSTDLYDWANLQYAMYLEQQSGKPVSTFGTFRGINKMIDLGKYNTRLKWNGNFAVLQTTGGAAFSVLGRPMPNDNSDANQMIAAKYDIENLDIKCVIGQIGIEPGPTYGSTFKGIIVSNATTAIHLRFNLDFYMLSCFATGCINGFLFDSGNWTNPSGALAQSNGSYCINSRCYMPENGNVGFGIYGSGGVTIESCIVEGAKAKRGVDINSFGNAVTKRNYVYNFHWETVRGTLPAGQGEAAIFIRMGGGVVEIKNIKGDYPSTMIDAATNGGWLTIDLQNMVWWKTPQDGKYWVNGPSTNSPPSGGVTWKFRNVEKSISDIVNGFAGNAVTQKCDIEGDANEVCIQ